MAPTAGGAEERRDETVRRVAESRARMIETLQRTGETIRDVIRQNELLAHNPEHRQSALERVREGHAELERVEEELDNLQDGRSLGGS